ncbi:MAG: efflux RND transporter permease subunit [bacterium]|nr:efflux RND transporter permease subunit [bacterium]
MKLSSLAINKPISVIVLLIAATVLGIFGYLRLPVNLLPDITYPMVKVYINWRGATPQEIEDSIATVVERRMATVDGLDYMESQCTEGMYALQVNFDYSVDRDVAYQDVLAKLGLVSRNLPADADQPYTMKADPSQLPVVDLMISSTGMDTTRLRTWVENALQDEFATVPGTAGTEVSGGRIREIRVNLDLKRLQYFGITPEQVSRKLKDENIQLMGGRVNNDRREFIIRTMGEFSSIGEIGSVAVAAAKSGGTVYVKDVARVEDASDTQRVITRLNGKEGVKLSVLKQAAANTVEVEQGVRKKIAQLKQSLPDGISMSVVYNQADYIKASVSGVRDAALLAALLVILVIAFFLKGWKRVLIVGITIPLTVLLTFFVTQLMGFSLNIFSLAGLVIAICLILDDCVVVIENITRIRRSDGDHLGLTELGTDQVAGAVLVSTVTFLALFVPFLLVPGLVSLLFRELILTIAVAVSVSTVTALTVTPALYKRFYPEERHDVESDSRLERISNAFLNACLSVYRKGAGWSVTHRRSIIAVTFGLFIIGLLLMVRLGSEFLPETDDGQIMIKVKMPTGTSVAETSRVIGGIEGIIQELPGVAHYNSLAGGKIWGLVTTEASNEGQVDLQLVPGNRRRMSTKKYVEWLSPQISKRAGIPGARIKVMHTKMKGIRTIGSEDIEAEVYVPRSEPVEEAHEVCSQILAEVRDTPGLANPDLSLDVSKPEYQVVVDRGRAADLGLSVSGIAAAIRAAVDGTVASTFKDDGYYYGIRTVISEQEVKSRESLEGMAISTPSGGNCYLRDVAQIIPSTGPVQIDRKNQMRVIKVTGSAQGKTVGQVTSGISRCLKDFALPSGYAIKLGGQSQMMAETFRTMGLILMLALFLGYVVLAIQFESLIEPFLIIIRVPLSLIGLSLALYMTGTPVGVTVMIGIVALAGIEIHHGVVLLTLVNQLREEGYAPIEAVIQAGATRLRPILMTLFVGVVGLIPLALGTGEGTETLQPMAIGVIGGLIFSLPLTLFFLPALYLTMVGRDKEVCD